MILKQVPQDFIVEEIPLFKPDELDKQINTSHTHKIYKLTKQGIDQFSVLKEIARKNRIEYKHISYAGIKDKYGITTQYISIPKKFSINTATKQDKKTQNHDNKYIIEFVGHWTKPIKRGDLIGNKFTIIIREIPESKKELLIKNASYISEGVTNYFDSQRMGSLTSKGFLGKFLVKRDYEGFVKLFLTNTTRHMNKAERHKRQSLLKDWNDPEKRFKYNPYIFAEKTWIERIYTIDAQEKEMAIAAYQSYLWNEAVKELLKLSGSKIYSINYAAGKLLFFKNRPEIPDILEGVHPKLDLNKPENEVYKEILRKEKVDIADFNITKTGNFFSKMTRKTIIDINNFSITDFLKDELHQNHFKIHVHFDLPKGSYATIVLKKIMGE